MALFLAIAFLVIVLGLLLGRQQLKERTATINEFFKDPSSGLTLTGRKMIWESTLGMIKDHPLLGIGPGNYWLEYPHYRSPGDFWGEYHAHNDFLQITAEGGLGSAILVLVLFVGRFRHLAKEL